MFSNFGVFEIFALYNIYYSHNDLVNTSRYHSFPPPHQLFQTLTFLQSWYDTYLCCLEIYLMLLRTSARDMR